MYNVFCLFVFYLIGLYALLDNTTGVVYFGQRQSPHAVSTGHEEDPRLSHL